MFVGGLQFAAALNKLLVVVWVDDLMQRAAENRLRIALLSSNHNLQRIVSRDIHVPAHKVHEIRALQEYLG